jgi:uncharacterized protein (AIM24 family)
MSAGAAILRWVARHLFSLALIILVLIALPPVVRWVKAETAVARSIPAQQAAQAEALGRFGAHAAERGRAAQAELAALPGKSREALEARRAAIAPAIQAQEAARRSRAQLALAGVRGDSLAIFNHYRAGAEIALLEREGRAIDALLAARKRTSLTQQRQIEAERVRASYATWKAARERELELNRRFLAPARNAVCSAAPVTVGCEHYRAMVAARGEKEAAARENQAARSAVAGIDGALKGLGSVDAVTADARAAFAAERSAMAAEVERLRQTSGRSWFMRVREVLPAALLILLGAMLSPLLFKSFAYFVVAPAAARRRPILLLPSDGARVAESGPSAVSQRVALAPGEELLVQPEALQSSPHHAEKRTQWLLNWSVPLSSLAAGMAGLVRLRVNRPDHAAVFAVGDALAEVAQIDVAEGSALVLRPRALVGLIQPVGRPVRLTRRWRIGHLSAWLTMQLRFLIFHGPCTVIVQGTRGVRVVAAGDGRGLNQANMIGFSAGLRYGVSRSEAFGPYLLGRQALFNDSFAGEGVYLYEELPLDQRKGGWFGRGLQGLSDAALKVFGL